MNSARPLKYLEDYGQRQAQVFTVLEKYHQVPDNLEDLKSQFNLLREATSRNVENLQQAINLQQAYSTALCGHVNIIFSRLTKLETEIQILTAIVKVEQDNVQLDAPDCDPDIDGPDTQQAHNTTAVVSIHELTPHLTQNPSMPQIHKKKLQIGNDVTLVIPFQKIPIGLTCFPQQVSDYLPADTFTESQQAATTEHNTYCEILQLEEEEDWENGQFADADTNLLIDIIPT